MDWSLNYSKSFITHSHNPFSYINLKSANESLYFLTDFNTNKLLSNLIDCSIFLKVVKIDNQIKQVKNMMLPLCSVILYIQIITKIIGISILVHYFFNFSIANHKNMRLNYKQLITILL